MYVPEHFAAADTALLHRLMRANAFALLVSARDGEPFATHLPVVLDAARGPRGHLRCHVARANPHWQALEKDPRCLVIFNGPHAYVSPRWYATHPSVPTWNYAAVHAYGTARIMDNAALTASLDDLVAEHEAGAENPWQVAGLPADWAAGMRRAIVGLEVAVERLEGKLKLSQNRDATDRRAVAAELAKGDETARAVAALMRETGS